MYLIGDIQGCNESLGQLLERIGFSASRDTLYFLGDLVNRGPDSVGVLRRLAALEDSARCVLGNHDLHLLAAAHGVRPPSRKDTLASVLDAPEREQLLNWVRWQPLARYENRILMVHAGVLPSWDLAQSLSLAQEAQTVLRGPGLGGFLRVMYGNLPKAWDDRLAGHDRIRLIVNAFTRLRFCSADGEMEFNSTESAANAPEGFMPWFDVPGRKSVNTTIAFGHWSTLGWQDRANTFSLDTGCVWGGCLSALKLGATPQQHELIQIQCPQALKPGDA
jgi:bis(5'-nucleosyl)-tetraphosphatase (symmetrical)